MEIIKNENQIHSLTRPTMIKRILNRLEEFFSISPKQARATFVLMLLCFCLMWTPFVFRRWILPLVPMSSEPVNTQKLDSIVVLLEREAQKQHLEREKTYAKKSWDRSPAKPVRLFRFDPNLVSTEQLQELGIPKFLALRIEKFRGKGGKFRKKEDLLHIYDFPSGVYERLEPYIVLPEQPSRSSFLPTPNKPGASPLPREVKTFARSAIVPFDMNTADTTQLIRLKGIGTKLSLRILKFRDGLGGFHSAVQYSEIFGLDSLAMSELTRYAKILSPFKKLNVNEATAEDLGRHPYLRNKKLAAVIVNYRQQHGPFQSLEDLKKVRVLDDATLEKLQVYLEF